MHLYTKDGLPVYEVPYADSSKGMRKATLADARKHGYVPSVTEITSIIASPALEMWKVKEAIWSAWTLPREIDESDDEFLAKVIKDSKEKASTAADKGTEIHNAIENAFNNKAIDSKYFEIAFKVKNAVESKYSSVKHWIAEKSFSNPLGYGGKIDLIGPPEIVLDFKTKEKFSPRMAYDNHILQLAAYAMGVGYRDALLVNVFVSWGGDIEFYEWSSHDYEWGWKTFRSCFDLWKSIKRYDPSFEQEAA